MYAYFNTFHFKINLSSVKNTLKKKYCIYCGDSGATLKQNNMTHQYYTILKTQTQIAEISQLNRLEKSQIN